jgi:hypothetical protein
MHTKAYYYTYKCTTTNTVVLYLHHTVREYFYEYKQVLFYTISFYTVSLKCDLKIYTTFQIHEIISGLRRYGSDDPWQHLSFFGGSLTILSKKHKLQTAWYETSYSLNLLSLSSSLISTALSSPIASVYVTFCYKNAILSNKSAMQATLH